jgi:hypothetical protein
MTLNNLSLWAAGGATRAARPKEKPKESHRAKLRGLVILNAVFFYQTSDF